MQTRLFFFFFRLLQMICLDSLHKWSGEGGGLLNPVPCIDYEIQSALFCRQSRLAVLVAAFDPEKTERSTRNLHSYETDTAIH